MKHLSDVEIDRRVHISGTQYDRRRILTDDEQDYARYLYNIKNYSLTRIASIMHMSVPGIMYIVEDDYKERKAAYNRSRTNTSYVDPDKVKITKSERIAYKRELLEAGILSLD